MEKQKDAVFYASGRLSHAVRVGHDPEIIEGLRRELKDAQIERDLRRLLADGVRPTLSKATELAALLMSAAGADTLVA